MDSTSITAFMVHECEGSSRIGSRPRRYLFSGHSNGSIQMWDLTTAMDIAGKVDIRGEMSSDVYPSVTSNTGALTDTAEGKLIGLIGCSTALGGPTEEELLELLDQCDLALTRTPDSTPRASTCRSTHTHQCSCTSCVTVVLAAKSCDSCPSSLHSQLSDSFRAERLHSAGGGRGGSFASLCGSLPRQAPPPVPPSKPIRDSVLSAGSAAGLQTLAVPAYVHNFPPSPSQSASPRPKRPDRDGAIRRGSFVERCQELVKGSEAAAGSGFGVLSGTDGFRRSLAVCSELEARFGLRTPNTLSLSSGARHSPGTQSSLSTSPLSSSLSHCKATPSSPTSTAQPPAGSPPRSQTPASPCHSAAASPADVPVSPESPAGSDSPASGPPTSPKSHMNETSF